MVFVGRDHNNIIQGSQKSGGDSWKVGGYMYYLISLYVGHVQSRRVQKVE
jgi:hypothetical protein